MSDVLNEAVARFLEQHPECLDPASIHDRCESVSAAFTDHLAEAGIEATMVSGCEFADMPDGRVLLLRGHFAVLAGSDVYDWTARQFQPTAPVPLVTPYDQWRQTWRNLHGT